MRVVKVGRGGQSLTSAETLPSFKEMPLSQLLDQAVFLGMILLVLGGVSMLLTLQAFGHRSWRSS